VLEPISFGNLSVAHRNIHGKDELRGVLGALRIVSLSVAGLPAAHVAEENVPIVVMDFGERWSVTTEVLKEGTGAVWGEPYVSAWPRLPLDPDEDLVIKARARVNITPCTRRPKQTHAF
jgi:hypothetical protein